MNNLKRTRIINNVEQKHLVQPITYYVVAFNKLKKKEQNWTKYCLGMHVCDKTIEESKEMIIAKVRIMATSERGQELCWGRSAGDFCSAGKALFLDLVGHMEVAFVITHYTELLLYAF